MRLSSCVGLVVLGLLVGLARPAAADEARPAAAAAPSSLDTATLARGAKIYRDSFGTPHIDGQTDEACVFAFGYCQAEDYFWQLEESYVMGLGRYAELYGEKELARDKLNRAFEVPQRSKADFETLDEDAKRICIAFTSGVNHFLDKHPEVKPRLITRFEPWHMISFGRAVILELAFGHTGAPRGDLPSDFPKLSEEIEAAKGSNEWALGPARTSSGKAMLFINPHQPYYGYGQFYEAHIRSAAGWNFTGATFFGSPLPTLGHNEYCGWAFTVNEPQTSNSWRETFDHPDHPLDYRYGDGYRTAVEWKDTIRVRKGRKMEDREFTFRKTHHGPIVKKNSETEYLSAMIGKFYDALLSRQSLKMLRARNLGEFREAMGMLDLHIFNTAYADRDGNIFYVYNGIIPKRNPGFDQTKPLDGADPRTEWQGYHTIDELPQTLNPPSGYLQNCNSSPYTITDDGSPDPAVYPDYMVREKHNDNRRAKVSRLLLRDMQKVGYDDWLTKIFDTTVYWAFAELPHYQRELELLKKSDEKLAKQVEPYLAHLLDWDCKGSLESTQATLCIAWYEELYGFGYPADRIKGEFVGNVPAQLAALVTAANKLKETFGDWKVAWGDVNRLQRHADVSELAMIPFRDDQPSLPSAGMQGPPGVAFTMYFTPSINLPPLRVSKKHYAVVGSSYMAAVEFGEKVRSRTLLQYGASANPKSPHFFDQAKLLSERQLKPELFYWEDVVKDAKRVYYPGEEPAPTAQAGK